MDTVFQLHEFFVEGDDPHKSHVLLNITEPSTAEERQKGYFFAICEIFNGNNDYILKLQNVVDDIENNYYETAGTEDKTSLEIVLDKINQQTFSLIRPGVEFNCVAGAIRQTDIIFSFYGRPLISLFYPDKQNEYKKIDLVSENKSHESEADKKQIFAHIIQGKINVNDYLFAGTSRIIDYFSHDRLQKIISSRPPRQSAEHLQRVLVELKNGLSFGGIIIHLQKQQNAALAAEKTSPIKKGGSAKSLANLFSTERNTADVLSPSILPRLGKIASAIKGIREAREETAKQEKECVSGHLPAAEIMSTHLRARSPAKNFRHAGRQIDWREKIWDLLNLLWTATKHLFRSITWLTIILATLLINIGRCLLSLFFVASNYRNRRQLILSSWFRTWKHYKDSIMRLPLMIKILSVLVIAALAALTIGVIYTVNNKKRQENAKIFAQTIQSIKTLTDSAESALIYDDGASALNNLKTAKSLLTKLSCDSKRQATCKTINSQLEMIFHKARKMTVVVPQLLADWTAVSPNQKAEKIFLLDKEIAGIGRTAPSMFIYNMLTKLSRSLPSNVSVNGFSAAAAPKEYDYAVLVHNANNLTQYKPTGNEWKKISIEYPNQNASVSAACVYNRRLYTLDSANSQIYRHDATKDGFTKGEEWLKDKTDINLNNGVGIAIDGNVFVLTADGKLYKFANGKKQIFAIQRLDPELKSADALWTYYELSYIYALDGVNKRLIILDKEGALKKQITANEFVRPTGMAIDEQNNTAYILDSNKLYKIELGL